MQVFEREVFFGALILCIEVLFFVISASYSQQKTLRQATLIAINQFISKVEIKDKILVSVMCQLI